MDADLRELEREWRADKTNFSKWRAYQLALKRSGEILPKGIHAPPAPTEFVTIARRLHQRHIKLDRKIRNGLVSKMGRIAAQLFRQLYGCSPQQKPYAIPNGYGKERITLVYAYPTTELAMVDKAIDTVLEQEKAKNAAKQTDAGHGDPVPEGY